MQLRKHLYESANRKVRADSYRRASSECGYKQGDGRWMGRAPGLAEVNHHIALLLDPPPRPPKGERRGRRSKPPMRGPDPSRVGGQLDAPPKKALRERR